MAKRPALSNNSGKPKLSLSDAETQKLIDEFSDIDQPKQSDESGANEAGDNETDSSYNPFPEGYGEDLLQ